MTMIHPWKSTPPSPIPQNGMPSSPPPSYPNKLFFGKPTYDGVIAGKVSGKRWKEVQTQRVSSVQVKKRTTAEQRSREKEIKEEIQQNKQEKRRLHEEMEKKKKENILKSGTKLQKITNPDTLKKIAKSKQRKLLKETIQACLRNSRRP
ncbi:hypothetical protein AAHA92_24436 [Salvia divinorum]|uniref:Coiled-coil domain-containing protein 86 n=1 Tax=Salvia divinorum TaxID=28513 RepID=A0ABD1G7D6_SALDI